MFKYKKIEPESILINSIKYKFYHEIEENLKSILVMLLKKKHLNENEMLKIQSMELFVEKFNYLFSSGAFKNVQSFIDLYELFSKNELINRQKLQENFKILLPEDFEKFFHS